MNLSSFGKKMFALITIVALAIAIPMIWFCWIVSVVVGVLYAGFIAFNVWLDRYCVNLIEKGNKETEEFARLNGYKIKKVSPEKFTEVIGKGSGDLGDEILVTKKDIHYL